MAVLRRKANGRYFIDYREGGARRRQELFVGAGGAPVVDGEVAQRMFDAFVSALERQREGAERDAAAGVKVRDMVAYYCDEYLPATNAAAKSLLKAEGHLDWFKMYLSEKRLGRVEQVTGRVMVGFGPWLKERKAGISEVTIGHYIASVRAMMNACYKTGFIDRVPVREWVLPAAPDVEVVSFTPGELMKTLELVHLYAPELYDVCCWMAWTGQRPSDAVSLRARQVDLRLGTVERVSVKVKRLRKFSLTPPALKLVKRVLAGNSDPDRLVFLQGGRGFSSDALQKRIRRLQEVEAFPLRWSAKTFRHTFGTLMANDPVCMPLPDLQVAMGHADIKTTMVYVKSVNGEAARERFAELLRG